MSMTAHPSASKSILKQSEVIVLMRAQFSLFLSSEKRVYAMLSKADPPFVRVVFRRMFLAQGKARRAR